MEITERIEGKTPVVAIKGDIDLETSPKLRQFLKPKVGGKCPYLILDFSDVSYIDSSGLATLIEYFQSAQSFKGKLAIYNLSPRVRNVFEIVRLQEVLTLHPDLTSALSAA